MLSYLIMILSGIAILVACFKAYVRDGNKFKNALQGSILSASIVVGMLMLAFHISKSMN